MLWAHGHARALHARLELHKIGIQNVAAMTVEICSYCGLPTQNAEEEHVFPRSWYPEASPPVKRPTVPSCTACNRDYGRLEERLQRHWALCLDPNDPAVRGVPQRVWRSLDPTRGRNLEDAAVRRENRARLNRSVRIMSGQERGAFPGLTGRRDQWRRANSALYVRGAPALMLPVSDVVAFTRKLVRGLYVYDHGARLPPDFNIQTFVIGEEAWRTELVRIAQWGIERRGVPPGFHYWTYTAPGQPLDSLWYFQIWGIIRLQAATLRSEQLVAAADS